MYDTIKHVINWENSPGKGIYRPQKYISREKGNVGCENEKYRNATQGIQKFYAMYRFGRCWLGSCLVHFAIFIQCRLVSIKNIKINP
jgi:hypothetical protein